MADKQTTTQQVQLDLTLSRANTADANRKLTFDVYNNSILPNVKDALIEQFIPSLVGGGLSTFIQPSGWRDTDESEEEYTCTLVQGKIITKTETTLDLS